MRNCAVAMARRCGQTWITAIRQGDTPEARDCNNQPEFVTCRIDAAKIRAGQAHPATPIRPNVNRIDWTGLVLSGKVARKMMNRNIHGSERQSVVNPDSACSAHRAREPEAAAISKPNTIDTKAAAGARKTEIRVA